MTNSHFKLHNCNVNLNLNMKYKYFKYNMQYDIHNMH